MTWTKLIISIILLIHVIGNNAESQSFVSLGQSLGTTSYSVNGISEDGSVIVGWLVYSTDSDSTEAMRWTQNTGFNGLGDLPGGYFSSASRAVSGDGQTVVGGATNSNPNHSPNEPFRWTQTTALEGLGYPPGADTTESGATDISTDGTTIVGNDSTGGWIWKNDAFTRIAQSANAMGVSADGSVVVGSHENGGIYRWTQSGGLVVIDPSPSSIAYGVSGDGNTIVGSMGPGLAQAFRWTQASGMVGIGRLPGQNLSIATEVSRDGSIIIGESFGPGRTAFIWKEEWSHMVSLRDFLEDSLGLVLPAWDLGRPMDINDEGDYIVGTGEEGWRAYIPSLTIRKPRATDRWIAGEQDTVRWWKSGVDSVNIYLSVDFENNTGTFGLFVADYPADSLFYLWDVHPGIFSKKCAIRIESSSDPTVADTSEVFRIKGYILTRDSSGNYEPFRVQEDGWSFANFRGNMWPAGWWQRFNYHPINGSIDPNTGNHYHSDFTSFPVWAKPQDFPDWPVFVRAFGVDQCYWDLGPLGLHHSPLALVYWGFMSRDWGGSCAGFARASVLGFDHNDDFVTRFQVPAFTNLHDLSIDDEPRRVVNEAFTYQLGTADRAAMPARILTSPTTTLEQLKQMLIADADDNRAIGYTDVFAWPPGGHLMNAYKVEQDQANPDIEHIYVYDNNFPGINTLKITVNTASDTWSYRNRSGNVGLFLDFPSSTFLEYPRLPTSLFGTVQGPVDGPDLFDMYVSTSASAIIRDEAGNALSYDRTDTLLANSIPGVAPFVPLTGHAHPPVSYFVPSGEYSVEAFDFGESTTRFAVFTDSLVLYYGRQDADSSQRDNLYWSDGVGVQNPDAATKSINLGSLLVEPSVSEKVIHLLNSPLSSSDSVYFAVEDHDGIRFENHGAATQYDLHLHMVWHQGRPRFEASVVSIDANSTHYVAPDWGDLSVIPIYIDLSNDGSIDDSIFVGNTVDVDDQGLLVLPKEYNLAQNYPNPFNPLTHIGYFLPQESHVRLTIYNILGQEVITLVDEQQRSGHHTVRWEGTNAYGERVGSGVYFYRIGARSTNHDTFVQTRKMLMVR